MFCSTERPVEFLPALPSDDTGSTGCRQEPGTLSFLQVTSCRFYCLNVDFATLPKGWPTRYPTLELGPPMLRRAALHSCSHPRPRSISFEEVLPYGGKPLRKWSNCARLRPSPTACKRSLGAPPYGRKPPKSVYLRSSPRGLCSQFPPLEGKY